VNSFEYAPTETEQMQGEQRESQTISRKSMPAPVSETDPEEERLSTGPGLSETVKMEPFPQPSYELSYSCLLIPRFSDHYLTGDITEDLSGWMKEICISYGWRLDAIMIRPGYLQWIMTVPLTTNPAQFMQITRQQTSRKIFDDYPRFKRKNLSGDFWALGFSITPGNQFQSAENISNFILQTRRNQGIS
jgi:REP element-mobilizing transposase RayT